MRLRYTKEYLEQIVLNSSSWAEVCRRVGVKAATGSQTHIKSRCVKFDIPFEHFTGQAHRKGKVGPYKRKCEDYFTNKFYINSHNLRIKMLREGIKPYRCEVCELDSWRNKPIPLELHHINNIHTDNELKNLLMVCPNCHAQM